MNRYWLVFLTSISIEVYGQNLIPDPYFNQVRNCTGQHIDDFSQYWYCPTDYWCQVYHVCIGNIPFSPNGVNHNKYQKIGDGMMSISLLSDLTTDSKSYIASPLSEPLKKGQPYYIRFFISPKMESNESRNIVADVAGMYLSSKKIQQDNITTLPFTAQIERRGTFFENYDHWYIVQGKHIAAGGEKYAIIGNFRSNKESNYKYNNPESGSVPNIAHVFIDDVLIEAFDPLPDTILLCDRQSITLNAGFHDARYQWNTGDRDSMITVHRTGKYRITAMIDTLEFEDSTAVIFMDDYAHENTVDTFLCEGSELILQAPVPGRYQWSNGNVSSSIVVREEEAYQLSVNNKCGRYRFTYHVSKRDCDCELVLPTAFSPNGDQRNDVLKVVDQCRYRSWRLGSFQVYDKWGGKVYQETGPTVSWNGLGTNSEELPPGVYTYRLIATIQEENGETPVIKTGSVHLLR